MRRYFRSRNSMRRRARWLFLSPRELPGHKIFSYHPCESQMPTWLPRRPVSAEVLRLRNRDNSRPWERWCRETLAWSPTLLRDGSLIGLCWIAAPILPAGPRDRERETRDSLFEEQTARMAWQKQKTTGIRADEEVPLRSLCRRLAKTLPR